jgi:hypothetical protein
MSRRPIWIDDHEVEVLFGYVAEILDDDDNLPPNYARTMFVKMYGQLEALLAGGHCDNCDYAYDTSSTEDRCGDCGLCHACCDHEAVPTQTLKPQYEY